MTVLEREIRKTAELFDSPYAPRPITTKKEHQHFLKIASFIMDELANDTRPSFERDLLGKYLNLVAHFIEEYEKQVCPAPDVPPHEMLEYLLQQSGLSQDRFAEILGTSQSALSEILHGRRKLTSNHIERLSRHFKLNPALFYSHAA